MEFFINGFLAAFGALAAIGTIWFIWNVWPIAIIFLGPVVLPKKTQAEFIRDLKKDKWRNADVLRITRRFGWHEEE